MICRASGHPFGTRKFTHVRLNNVPDAHGDVLRDQLVQVCLERQLVAELSQRLQEALERGRRLCRVRQQTARRRTHEFITLDRRSRGIVRSLATSTGSVSNDDDLNVRRDLKLQTEDVPCSTLRFWTAYVNTAKAESSSVWNCCCQRCMRLAGCPYLVGNVALDTSA